MEGGIARWVGPRSRRPTDVRLSRPAREHPAKAAKPLCQETTKFDSPLGRQLQPLVRRPTGDTGRRSSVPSSGKPAKGKGKDKPGGLEQEPQPET